MTSEPLLIHSYGIPVKEVVLVLFLTLIVVFQKFLQLSIFWEDIGGGA